MDDNKPDGIGSEMGDKETMRSVVDAAKARITRGERFAGKIVLPGNRKQRREIAKSARIPWEMVGKITAAENVARLEEMRREAERPKKDGERATTRAREEAGVGA